VVAIEQLLDIPQKKSFTGKVGQVFVRILDTNQNELSRTPDAGGKKSTNGKETITFGQEGFLVAKTRDQKLVLQVCRADQSTIGEAYLDRRDPRVATSFAYGLTIAGTQTEGGIVARTVDDYIPEPRHKHHHHHHHHHRRDPEQVESLYVEPDAMDPLRHGYAAGAQASPHPCVPLPAFDSEPRAKVVPKVGAPPAPGGFGPTGFLPPQMIPGPCGTMVHFPGLAPPGGMLPMGPQPQNPMQTPVLRRGDAYNAKGEEVWKRHLGETEAWTRPLQPSYEDYLFGKDPSSASDYFYSADTDETARRAGRELWNRAPLAEPSPLYKEPHVEFPDMDVRLVKPAKSRTAGRINPNAAKDRRIERLPEFSLDGWMDEPVRSKAQPTRPPSSLSLMQSKSQAPVSWPPGHPPPPPSQAGVGGRRGKLMAEEALMAEEDIHVLEQQRNIPDLVQLDANLWPVGTELQVVGCVDDGSLDDLQADKPVWVSQGGSAPRRYTRDAARDAEWLDDFEDSSLRVGLVSLRGQRDSADSFPSQDNFSMTRVGETQIFVVCDGHGPFGHHAAFRIAQSLPKFLLDGLRQGRGVSAEKAITEAFQEANEELGDFARRKKVDLSSSGTTCAMVLQQGALVHTAWAGDSRVLVATVDKNRQQVEMLSNAHTTDSSQELVRFRQSGADIREAPPGGALRIFQAGARFPGIFATRAFGDYAAMHLGLNANPEVHKRSFEAVPGLMLLSTGGLWEVFDEPGQVLRLIVGDEQQLNMHGPQPVAAKLANAAQGRWRSIAAGLCDDITCILLDWTNLLPPPTQAPPASLSCGGSRPGVPTTTTTTTTTTQQLRGPRPPSLVPGGTWAAAAAGPPQVPSGGGPLGRSQGGAPQAPSAPGDEPQRAGYPCGGPVGSTILPKASIGATIQPTILGNKAAVGVPASAQALSSQRQALPPGSIQMKDPRRPGQVRIVAFASYPGPEEEALTSLCAADFLSNSFELGPRALTIEAPSAPGRPVPFSSAEAAYQALLQWDVRAEEFSRLSAQEAFELGRVMAAEQDGSCGGFGSEWAAMMAVLRVKFAGSGQLARKLLETGDAYILAHDISDGTWSDGQRGDGRNWLGLQLMILREELAGGDGAVGGWLNYITQRCNIDVATGLTPDGGSFVHIWQDSVRSASSALQSVLQVQQRSTGAAPPPPPLSQAGDARCRSGAGTSTAGAVLGIPGAAAGSIPAARRKPTCGSWYPAGADLAAIVAQQCQEPVIMRPDASLLPASCSVQILSCMEDGGAFNADKPAWLRVPRTPSPRLLHTRADIEAELNKLIGGGPLKAALLCRRGRRSPEDGKVANQDAFSITKAVDQRIIYLVCDGHGPFGHIASFRTAQILPACLLDGLDRHRSQPPESVIAQAFEDAQKELGRYADESGLDLAFSGTACCLLLQLSEKTYMASLGDARIVVATVDGHNYKADVMTKAHVASDPEEGQRLTQSGASLRSDQWGMTRVYAPDAGELPSLSISRALGDFSVANLGVSSQPSHFKTSFSSAVPGLVLLASGGLCEFYDTGDAVLDALGNKGQLASQGPSRALGRFCDLALEKWRDTEGQYCEDITGLLLFWPPAGAPARPATSTTTSVISRPVVSGAVPAASYGPVVHISQQAAPIASTGAVPVVSTTIISQQPQQGASRLTRVPEGRPLAAAVR